MKIAIIGTGIAGLSAAWHLNNRHDLVLFEAAERPGGHAWTVDHEGTPIDVGFMVFNDATYPGLVGLFRKLGCVTRETCMSFSVRTETRDFEYQGSSLRGFFARRRHLFSHRHWRLLRMIMRFGEVARCWHQKTMREDDGITISAWCNERGLGADFLEHYLLPIGSAMWSCGTAEFQKFPARFVIGFMFNHRMLQIRGRPQWRTLVGGAAKYVDSLLKRLAAELYLNEPVVNVRRTAGGVLLKTNRREQEFDHVVMACHADTSNRILENPTAGERDFLRSRPFTTSKAVLHTDVSILPKRRSAWASWNYLVNEVGDSSTITYDLARLQGHRVGKPLLLTLNPGRHVDSGQILRTFEMAHPSFAHASRRDDARIARFTNIMNVSHCGAWSGFGFHEDGFQSGKAVAEALA